MVLPAEIRFKIYAAFADIDRFKVDCFDEFAAVFNPYFDRLLLSEPIVFELYKDMQLGVLPDNYLPKYKQEVNKLKHMYKAIGIDHCSDEYCQNSCCKSQIKLNVFTAISCDYLNHNPNTNDIYKQEHPIAMEYCLSYITNYYHKTRKLCPITNKYLLNVSNSLFYILIHITSNVVYATYEDRYLDIFIKYYASKAMRNNLASHRDSVVAMYMKDINGIYKSQCIVQLLTNGHAKQMYNQLAVKTLAQMFEEQVLSNIYE